MQTLQRYVHKIRFPTYTSTEQKYFSQLIKDLLTAGSLGLFDQMDVWKYFFNLRCRIQCFQFQTFSAEIYQVLRVEKLTSAQCPCLPTLVNTGEVETLFYTKLSLLLSLKMPFCQKTFTTFCLFLLSAFSGWAERQLIEKFSGTSLVSFLSAGIDDMRDFRCLSVVS